MDSSGNQQVLTGQQITATLSGIPGNFTVTKYTWSGVGSAFKTYNEKATSNQLVPLGPGDLSGSSLAFYDGKQENLTVTCAITVNAPDGTSLSLTATAPTLDVKKPTAIWTVQTGCVQPTAKTGYFGLLPAPGTGYPGGEYWQSATITVPSPFSGGSECSNTPKENQMQKAVQNRPIFAALIGLPLLAVLLVSTPTASAQSSGASKTHAAETQKAPALTLPPGVFLGSLPPGRTDPALVEASNKAYNAILHGEALLKSGDVPNAIAEFQAALVYEPDNGSAYQHLAEAYIAAGKLPQASQAFHKALIEHAGSGVGGNADIWEEYALVLVKTHQPAEAVQMYNHGASLLDYEDSQYHGGKPFLEVLFPEVVLDDALPGQVLYTPERLQALADTTLAHEEIFNKNKEAQAYMQEAVKLYPDSAVTHYYLGEVLPSRSPAQKAAYQKAAELGDDGTVAAAKERLAVLR